MRKLIKTTLFFCFLGASFSTLAQRYSSVIDQQLTWEDLQYMPKSELNLLKNEIIAIKGMQQKSDKGGPLQEYNGLGQFLSSSDQANIRLIDKVCRNNEVSLCSEKDLFTLFLENARNKQKIPIYLSQKFYGFPISEIDRKNQWEIKMSDQFITLWIPGKINCEACYHNNQLFTYTKEGQLIDQKSFNGKLVKSEGTIVIEESKNALKMSSNDAAVEKFMINSAGKIQKI